ncbi:hypothetical protein PMAYCL1PPCAC_09032, partial [Pristionchus mayeri]
MKDELYQHLCTILLGVATLFRYAGYAMASFIVESVLYSAHLRDSSAIISHAGFYGQAVREVSMCVTSLMVPIFFHGSKTVLIIGSFLNCFYTASFLYINNFFFFSANVLTGLARSLTHIGVSTYMMQFSTKDTLARNSARITAIAGSALTIGATLYMFISGAESDVEDGKKSEEYRYYSEEETRIMCGAFTILLFISFLLHCLLPNRQIENSVESENPRVKQSAAKQFKAIAETMINPSILKLIPVLIKQGLFQSFAMGIYPTSLQFSARLSKDYPQMTAYYAYAMFAANLACGVIVEPLTKRIRDFGLRPLFFLTLGLDLLMILICWLSVPNWSTAMPTDAGAFIEPNLLCTLLASFLIGLIDSTSTASSTVYCSRILPGKASHVYAAARFYIGTASALVFLCSPSLSMTHHGIIQVI